MRSSLSQHFWSLDTPIGFCVNQKRLSTFNWDAMRLLVLVSLKQDLAGILDKWVCKNDKYMLSSNCRTLHKDESET